ncbi:MAG: hypothetical protein M1826_004825 [Phylliscum demangeonii]|nr:MAG: hypothetical protein M1826_004825 [Phylliscum demangeonii]
MLAALEERNRDAWHGTRGSEDAVDNLRLAMESRGAGLALLQQEAGNGPYASAGRGGLTQAEQDLIAHLPGPIQDTYEEPLPPSELVLLPRKSHKRLGNLTSTGGASQTEEELDEIKPTVPLKAGRNSPPRVARLPFTAYGPVQIRAGTSPIRTSLRVRTTFTDTPSPLSSAPPAEWTPSPSSSVMDRPRPFQTPKSANTKATSRKPLTATPDLSRAPTVKSLPTTPPEGNEANSEDYVSTLQAQLDNIRNQRLNLQTFTDTLRRRLLPIPQRDEQLSRQDLEKTVAECTEEIEEKKRVEHELGMRLHMAWKRRERDGTEPLPALWVRRVTS